MVTSVPKVPRDIVLETRGAKVWVTKFDIPHYHLEDVFLRVNPINDPYISLRSMSDGHVLLLLQSLHAYGFDPARGTLSVKTTVAASRSEENEKALSATPRKHDEEALQILYDERDRLQVLRDLQKPGDIAWVEALLLEWCVTRHEGRSIAQVAALKLSSLENKFTSTVRRD